MTILLTFFGAGLIIVALRDIFNSLFHPLGSATVTRILIVRPLWVLFRRLGLYRHTVLESAGPSIVLALIGSWVAFLVVGWALIYWPYLPTGFMMGAELSPSAHSPFIDALYLSMTTLTTLGYGDITPTSEWLKIIAPLEAMVGFGLFTVSLSTVVSIYQVLRRRRTLALEVTLLRERESTDGSVIAQMNPMIAQQVLSSLALQLNTVWNDLVQFPITYYFTSRDSQTELSAVMLYLFSMVEEGTKEDCSPEIYFGALMLRGTIHAFTALLTRNFLGLPVATPAKQVLAAYAHDHLQVPST